MATASQLMAEVRRIIRDDSYPAETILGFLNDGLLEVSSWENDTPELGLVGNILLPALETSDTVTTSLTDPFVDLPEDYQKNLYRVTFEGQTSPVSILSNMNVFLANWDNVLTRSGPVSEVTVMGGRLYYQPVPEEAAELTLWYYRKPAQLLQYDPDGEDTDDTPTCIPDQLHKGLLVNYAAKEIFDEIEDGVDGQKVNTAHYSGKYQAALAKLYASIRHKSKQVSLVRRHASFF